MVRPANQSDAPAIAAIYNQGIEDRVATFEIAPREWEEIVVALRDRGDRYPTVVVELASEVAAVAWASPYRPRACYDGIAEFSVYVERRVRGRGLGVTAMDGLLDECRARGFWKLVSRVFPENEASRRLLRKLGFQEVGRYRRHAQLDGVWRDCVIVELLLDE